MRLIVLTCLAGGCIGYAEVATGPAVTLMMEDDTQLLPEWNLVTRTAIGPRLNEGPSIGLGASARTRLGDGSFDLSAGPEVCAMSGHDGMLVSVCPGASLLTLGYRDDSISLGALSPHVTASIAKRTNGPMGWSLGGTVGYDVRVTEQASSPWIGMTIGYGVVGVP